VRRHKWQECRPAIIDISGGNGQPLNGEALEIAWSLVPDADRLLFHEYCCFRMVDSKHLDAMERIVTLLRG
jgi:hypothetical protein